MNGAERSLSRVIEAAGLIGFVLAVVGATCVALQVAAFGVDPGPAIQQLDPAALAAEGARRCWWVAPATLLIWALGTWVETVRVSGARFVTIALLVISSLVLWGAVGGVASLAVGAAMQQAPPLVAVPIAVVWLAIAGRALRAPSQRATSWLLGVRFATLVSPGVVVGTVMAFDGGEALLEHLFAWVPVFILPAAVSAAVAPILVRDLLLRLKFGSREGQTEHPVPSYAAVQAGVAAAVGGVLIFAALSFGSAALQIWGLLVVGFAMFRFLQHVASADIDRLEQELGSGERAKTTGWDVAAATLFALALPVLLST